MRPVPFVRRLLLVSALTLVMAGPASADDDRSANINQVSKSGTLAERSSAAFDQISTVASGRSGVSQIDPALALKDTPGTDPLSAGPRAASSNPCILTPEQQSIVTSLEAQGKLSAGDCEMIAWFAEPGDKSEADERQSVAESVVAGAPDLLGRDSEADRLASEAEDQARAEAIAAAVVVSIFTPPPPVSPGK